MKTKRCSTHDAGKGRLLPISEFYSDRQSGDGLQRRCKDCLKSMRRERYSKSGPTFRDLYAGMRGRARNSGILFGISHDDFVSLLSMPCAYGGSKRPQVNIGIDRKDPRGAYTVDNVVPCCGKHNQIKGDVFTFDSMMRIVSEFDEAKECSDTPRYQRKFTGQPRKINRGTL